MNNNKKTELYISITDEKGSMAPKDQQHTTKVKSNSDDECDMGDTSFTEEVRKIFL